MNTTHRTNHGNAGFGLLAVVIALGFIATVAFAIANATHIEHRTCTVESKDRTTTKDGTSDARVYTTNCGVLHVSDSLLSLEFNSADTYAAMKPGRTYDVTTRGYRIGLLSMFPNVVEASEVGR